MKYIITLLLLCILLTSCVSYNSAVYETDTPTNPVLIEDAAEEAVVTQDIAEDLDNVVTDLEAIEEILN
jgi:PBP1b-binding outer membrane lipoprotein LpoB